MCRPRNVLLLVLLLALAISAGAVLQAAPTGTKNVEALAEKFRLSGGDASELVRSYRGALNSGVDQKRLEGLIERSLGVGIEPRYVGRALVLIADSVVDGLPANALLNKFSEGLAKGADGRRLVDALEKKALSLKQARVIVSELVFDEGPMTQLDLVLATVASALERGASEQQIEKVFKQEGPSLKNVLAAIEKLD